jgi:TPP-dependent pyruvate/acetoin dehydrogenase alpha subunit
MKEVTQEVYLKWYEDMLLWRKFEDKLAALYIQQSQRIFTLYMEKQYLQVRYMQWT